MMDENKKTPQIRFAGFTAYWKKRELGELGSFKNGMNFSKEAMGKGYPFVNLQNIFGRNIIDINNIGLSEATDAQLREYNLQQGDVLFVRSSVKLEGVGEAALVPKHLENTTYSGFIIRFRDESNMDDNFKRFVFGIKSVRDQIMAKATNSANKNISQDVLDNLELLLPSGGEQQIIGAFFSNLDSFIIFHQRKYEKLNQIKKSMLEKMFPRNGSNVPEIRFAGFTGAWERRKFSEIAATRRGLTYKPGDIVDRGKRVLRSSNINEDIFEIHEDDVFVNEGAVNIPYVKDGDILITSANGSSRLVGKHAIVRDIPDNCAVHGGFMLLASSDEPEFVNALMSSQWYTKFINIFVAGGNGAIGNLNKNDLDEQTVSVPSKNEREKIGAYFSSLDNLIILHQRKYEKLRQIKKSLLEKMFV